MSVIGVDIGDNNIYISVARLGGVDTIANEYSQRNTPSIVGLGGRQRFMGVSAENQRNINIRNSVSYFKNFLGRSFKDPFVQNQHGAVGAEVVELKDGKLGYKIDEDTFVGEQVLGMLLTKVREIVRADQGEEVDTCVLSVPQHFTQTQRLAVLDAAKIAGLSKVHLMTDTSALALAYGKTKTDLPESECPRFVVFLDAGCSSVQSSLVAVTANKAVVLGSSSSTNTGGKFLDRALLEFVRREIEAKHKCDIKDNPKALNKLRLAVEKIKKQMSANSNKLPLQIENLVEDIDVNISLERSKFEELIKLDLDEVRKTLTDLLNSTTVKKDQIHSVEVVGGSSRIPAVRNIVQEIFGLQPSSSLNADEAVSRGCGLMAANLSNKFRTKPFEIEEIVSHSVEAVFTSREGSQDKILILDEGEKATEERLVHLKADLPLHLAVQYGENVDVDNRFICLYQLGAEQQQSTDLELVFRMSQDGLVELDRAHAVTRDETKRRKTSGEPQPMPAAESEGGAEVARTPVNVQQTQLGGLPSQLVTHLAREEQRMIAGDAQEVARQEAKNVLEENLYKYRAEVSESSEGLEEEENTQKLKTYFDEIEAWLYEEGEDAPEESYKENLLCLHQQVSIYQTWKTKFLQQKAREDQQRRYAEQQQRRPQTGGPAPGPGRQIPVVYEGAGPYTYTAPRHRPHSAPRDTAQDSAECGAGTFSHRGQHDPRDFRRQMMEDPFFSRSSFNNGGHLFGYGW